MQLRSLRLTTTAENNSDDWRRVLTITAIAQTFSIIGFSFVTPFLPLFIQRLGVHGQAQITLWAAVLSGGSALCMAVSAPIWGVLADRHGRKIMLVRASFSAALLIGAMGLSQNVWQLLVLRMLQGAFTGTVTASQALISSQSPKNKLGFSLGVMQTSVFLGNSIGPLLGGVVADLLGYRTSFLAGAASLFIAGVLVTFFVTERKPEAPAAGEPRVPFWSGARDALRSPAILPMVVTIFAVQFGVTVVFPILPQFVQLLEGSSHYTATVTGIIFTGSGIAGAIASITVGAVSDRLGYRRVIMIGLGMTAVLSFPQAFVTAIWQLFLLRIAIDFSMGAVLPSASALIASKVPSNKRGTAYGLMGSATSLGAGSGPLASATVVAFADIRATFVMAGLLFILVELWVATALRTHGDPAAATPSNEGLRRRA
jgi:DHA1 family multidrug resistance protein-like MFS transporter